MIVALRNQRTGRICPRSFIEILEDRRAPATFIVNVVSDAPDMTDIGDGVVDCDLATLGNQVSLRGAMQEANAIAGADRINFNIPPGGFQTIDVGSPLPVITDPLFINGSSQPGIPPNTPGITLNGAGAGNAHGLDLVAGDSTIEGLVIHRFNGYGIFVHVKGNNVLDNLCVGVDHDGETAAPNKLGGIQIFNVPKNVVEFSISSGNDKFGISIGGKNATENVVQFSTIGLDRPGTHALANVGAGIQIIAGASKTKIDGSFISGNIDDGILIAGKTTHGNFVTRNFIGLDISGFDAVPNGVDGVAIIDAGGNEIGGITAGTTDSGRNVISGNMNHGVSISNKSAAANSVIGNIIGLAANGSVVVPNHGHGVLVSNASNTTIGGVALTDRNIISGNMLDGVAIVGPGATQTAIVGNYIGTDLNGTRATTSSYGNIGSGISVSGAPAVKIGGGNSGEGNVISDNFKHGIDLAGAGASNATIRGNIIGLDKTAKIAIGNQMDGIHLFGVSRTTVGGKLTADANVISGNFVNGIEIAGSGAAGNDVFNNRIGTDVDGTLDRGNRMNGILIDGARGNSIGEVQFPGNLISGNDANGIQITGASARGNLIVLNQIGVNATGDAALANAMDGVRVIDAPTTFIGRSLPDSGNVISGNAANGIHISGSKATFTQILGNAIGTREDRTQAIPNGADGVLIEDAPESTVGSSIAANANVISGNGANGIEIKGERARGSRIGSNLIGVTGDATAALANNEDGILIDGAPATRVGATDGIQGNVISGNGAEGIEVRGPNVRGTLIAGNFIGTDRAGTVAIGNTSSGIFINNGANVIVGGLDKGARNIISGNKLDGIDITGADAQDNAVRGNYIGTDITGIAQLANFADGILIANGAFSNDVGGDPKALNVIAGNGNAGVEITGAATMLNQVTTNLIGLNSAGTPLANMTGVLIAAGANQNIIGTSQFFGIGNTISGNLLDGVLITGAGSDGNEVNGNFIGTDRSDAGGLGNGRDGLRIAAGASENAIGNTKGFTLNVISGNNQNGITITGAATTKNVVDGNFIGTDSKGANALANSANGILIDGAPGNVIGTTRGGNLISGNKMNGILLDSANAAGNTLTLNLIGVTDNRKAALPNQNDGVEISGGMNNTIDSNLISGNTLFGVSMSNGATGNTLLSNIIGAAFNGKTALPNLGGVLVAASPANDIGTGVPTEGNLISGNNVSGIVISGAASIANNVFGNFIGTDLKGEAPLPNQDVGILIDGAVGNAIGTFPAKAGANVISGNGSDGIRFVGAATLNTIDNNLIGTNKTGTKPLGNAGPGVSIDDGTGNRIGGAPGFGAGNTIAFNAQGVVIVNGTGNRIQQNSIFSNTGLGIDLGNDGVTLNDDDSADDADAGPNRLQNFPVISVVGDAVNASISLFLQSTPNASFEIELFQNSDADETRFGEGRTYLMSRLVTTDANGRITDNFETSMFQLGSIITATATDLATNDTSEFSGAVTVRNAPPQVGGIEFVKTGSDISSVILSFTEMLNPKKAKNVKSYALVDAGNDDAFGTPDDATIKIASAAYDATNKTVTLTPTTAFGAAHFVKVTALANGITDRTDLKLDGEFDGHFPSGDGTPGGDFILIEGRGTNLAYKDADGDAVTIALSGGGTMELFRSANGEGELLNLINVIAALTTLNGNVTQAGNGNGTTTLNEIRGLDGATNNLPPDKFTITG